MNTIKIINDDKEIKQDEKSALYINVFGEAPRNEGYKCTTCEKLFSLSTVVNNSLEKCLCSGDLKKVYDKEQIKKERADQANKSGYM